MIAGGITPDDDGQVAAFQIFQRNRGSSGPQRLIEPYSTGLMTLVAAVIDIVGTVQSRHQLQ